MGEIADMMLEGDLCEACGVALVGEGFGVPRYCSNQCAIDRGYSGIDSNGCGTYSKVKGEKGPAQQCLTIRISYNGQPLFKDGAKKFTMHDTPKQEAKVLARKIRTLITKHYEREGKDV